MWALKSVTGNPCSRNALAVPPVEIRTTPVSTSVSANGTQNGIVWAVENRNPAVLHAYDARDLSHELYNSTQAPNSRDAFGVGNKFITPTIVNGRVYVGTTNGVAVFGMLVPVPAPPTGLRIVPR